MNEEQSQEPKAKLATAELGPRTRNFPNFFTSITSKTTNY